MLTITRETRQPDYSFSCPGKLLKTNDQEDLTPARDKGVFCRACSHLLTRESEAVSPQGSHEHTFFNPAGVLYELCCFAKAPGVVTTGLPSTEFSWFAGYSWQIGYCKHCGTHLGWHFSHTGHAFYGLIKKKLM
ncbi:MAG: hypothetical protein CSA21_04040 [Deltaproteobacteria bacterium]|nr:MAG: hypothetical protein CSA21_04040 [Deltaproteobacteria bacterium]